MRVILDPPINGYCRNDHPQCQWPMEASERRGRRVRCNISCNMPSVFFFVVGCSHFFASFLIVNLQPSNTRGIAGMTTPNASGRWKRQSAAGGALGATFHVTCRQFFSLSSVALTSSHLFQLLIYSPVTPGAGRGRCAVRGPLTASLKHVT